MGVFGSSGQRGSPRPEAPGEGRRGRGGIGAPGVLGLLLLGLLAWLAVPMVRHSINHASFERKFRHLPLPADTTVVATVSRFGLLSGSGNHCDSIAVSLLRSTLPRARLEAFYQTRTTEAAEGSMPVELHVEPLGDAAHPENLYTLLSFDPREAFRHELAQTHAGALYVLYAADHYPANSDFRCH